MSTLLFRLFVHYWHIDYKMENIMLIRSVFPSYAGSNYRFHRNDARAWLYKADIFGKF